MILAKAVFNSSRILPTMFKLRPNSLRYRAENTAAVGLYESRANLLIKESNTIHIHTPEPYISSREDIPCIDNILFWSRGPWRT